MLFYFLTFASWGRWPMSHSNGRRTCSGDLRRSTVAHFARKVRGTNIAAAKHGMKTQQGHGLEHVPCSLRVRGPHFASKVSYNAGAATDDRTGPHKSPPLPPTFNISIMPPNGMPQGRNIRMSPMSRHPPSPMPAASRHAQRLFI